MAKIKVQVTQEDIDSGRPGDVYECPVAKALQRVMPHWARIRVGWYQADFYLLEGDFPHFNSRKAITLPPQITDFIRAFDDNLEEVKPFEFEIEEV